MRRAICLVLLAGCGRTLTYQPRTAVPDAGVKPCMSGIVPLSHTTPAIFFVIDRSGSMAFDLKGNMGPPLGDPLEGPSRWEILGDVMSGVLPVHNLDLAMGAVMFPSNDECGFTRGIDVMPRTMSAFDILSLFNREPGGGTPIAPAIEWMRTAAQQVGAKSIVLITDGEPNCNAMLDVKTCTCTQATIGFPPVCPQADVCLDDQRTVQAIQTLFTDGGVVTHVVGFATTSGAAVTLDAMAVAGGAPRSGAHKFNSAETKDELAGVLEGISARETNCTWTALTKLEESDVLEVLVNGETVPEGDGWVWADRAQGAFALRSTWCERSLQGATVQARLTCR